ncbi:sensor histidine kinase [Heyndrickxia shackletonii]|nr:sensor histidine kinase [Heyndrickxia shackletonii]NEY97699.1 sensor histidine kinase [Heyndrickxia shackletonii]
MKKGSFLSLSLTRIFMFLLLSSSYFTFISDNNSFKRIYIIAAMIIYIVNHFIQFSTEKISVRLLSFSIDFILSAGFGFLFIKEESLIYLIFFGVIATSIFLVMQHKKILVLFSVIFFIIWILISYEKYIFTQTFSIGDNILNFMFVVFCAIVGSLIRNLINARETISTQFTQLNDSHEELRKAHQQLSEYSKQVEDLTVIQERNRIAREIHDTVGHNMTALLVQIQLAKELLKIDVPKGEEVLDVCEKLTRNSLEEIRLSVRTLRDEKSEQLSFVPSLRSMLSNFSTASGLETNLNIVGDPKLISSSLQPTIKRVIQESLTNAKRHGLATFYKVTIQISQNNVSMEIFDNGQGTKNVVPSFGLINMKERIQEHGGEIHFEGKVGEGFYINISIPLKQLQWSSTEVKR